MNIAMMSAWNSDSGVSVHAELIGREWIKMGHRLHVFSFFSSDFHGTTLLAKDEDYVVRCFTTSKNINRYLDPRPFLSLEYDIFIAQDLGMLPKDELAKIFHHIQRKANALTIIHDSQPSSDPSFYQFDWDRIICFDHRYETFLKKYHPAEKVVTIPFPCHPLRRGDQKEARARLGLPQNRKILLIFGQRIKEHLPLLPVIKEIHSHLPILLLIVSQKDLDELRGMEGIEIEIREESPDLEALYHYLHASDVLILHRNPCDGVVVSSAAFQCLGSGCPILASNTSFFETLGEVVVTYSDLREFKDAMIDLLNGGERYQTSQRALVEFLSTNSVERVAKQYLDLFNTLREERKESMFYQVSQIIETMKPITSDINQEKLSIPSMARIQNSNRRRLQPH